MKSYLRSMAFALLAIILFALAPVLSIAAASGIATAFDCKLGEADSHPCMVAGFDFGELLYGMFVAGWLALATLPLGAILLMIWVIIAFVLYLRRSPARTPGNKIPGTKIPGE